MTCTLWDVAMTISMDEHHINITSSASYVTPIAKAQDSSSNENSINNKESSNPHESPHSKLRRKFLEIRAAPAVSAEMYPVNPVFLEE